MDLSPHQLARLNKYLNTNKSIFSGGELPGELFVGYIDFEAREHWTDEDMSALYDAVCWSYGKRVIATGADLWSRGDRKNSRRADRREKNRRTGDRKKKMKKSDNAHLCRRKNKRRVGDRRRIRRQADYIREYHEEALAIHQLLETVNTGEDKGSKLLRYLRREYSSVYNDLKLDFEQENPDCGHNPHRTRMSLDAEDSENLQTGNWPEPYRPVALELYYIMRFVLKLKNQRNCVKQIVELLYKHGWLTPEHDMKQQKDITNLTGMVRDAESKLAEIEERSWH